VIKERPYRRLLKYYVLFAGAVYVFALLMTAAITFKNMGDNRAAKQEELVHSAQLFREHVDRIFGNVDWIMETARTAYLEAPTDKAKLEKTLVALGQREEFAYFITIASADGRSIASSLRTSDVDLSDRPHVKVFMQPDAPTLYIGEPRMGPRSGVMGINISRKIIDDQGVWRGIAIVSFDPSRIATFLKSLSINETGVATLVRTDGAVLARSTPTGSEARFDTALFQTPHDSIRDGQFTLVSPIDGVHRMFAFERLLRLPLIVVVGFDYDYFDRERTEWLLLSGLWISLLALALIGIGYLIRKFILAEERRHVEQLAEAERLHTAELIQSAFNSAGVFVIVFDKTSGVRFANRPARELIDSLATPPGDLLRALEQSDRTPVAHISPATTHWVRLNNESMRTICWSVASAEWVGPDCLVAIGFDRTDAEHVERMLNQKARLTALGEISVGIAHEVAQPLTIINFTSRRMERDPSSRKIQEEGLATIKSAATRAGRILGQIKTFAKQYDQVEGAIFDVAECVEAIELLMRRQLDDRGIALKVEAPGSTMFSKGDPHLLEQILLNLVLNARDALRAREDLSAAAPVISISWRADGEKLAICVADNGPGIAAEHQSRIFEPFFTTKKGGTGLGLPLSFSMARQMGGSLSLMSGRAGASFLIELPLAQSSEEEAVDAPASAAE
jgi:signal transduction histidine kinase